MLCEQYTGCSRLTQVGVCVCVCLQRQELLKGDHVRVRMSPNPVPTINKADQTTDWFESLDRCFGWNERMEQKPLEGQAKPPALTEEAQNGAVSV